MNLNAPHDAIRLPKGSDYLHQIFFYLPFGYCIARAVVREESRPIGSNMVFRNGCALLLPFSSCILKCFNCLGYSPSLFVRGLAQSTLAS